MGMYKRWMEDMSNELLRYGRVRFDLQTEETNGCRRIRVIESKLNRKKYIHHMFNGDLIELIEI